MRLAVLWAKDRKWFRSRCHWLSFLVFCLLPACFSIGYCVFNKGDYTPHHNQEVIISHEQPPSFPKNYQPPFLVQVFLPASIDKTENAAIRKFCGNLCDGFNFTDYKNDEDFVGTDEHTAFLIVKEWDLKKPSLKYKYVDFQWKLQSLLSPLWGLWSMDQKARGFQEQDGYAALVQRMIDGHFYQRRECFLNSARCLRRGTRQSFDGPYEVVIKHSAMPFFNPASASTATLFAQMSIFFALIEIWQLAKQLADERKAKTKIFLEGLGVSRVQYFLAYFVPLYFKFLLMQLILWIIPTIWLNNVVNIHVVYPGILIFSAVLSSFALLLATIFHNPLSVKLGSIIILFILHLGQFGLEEHSGMTDAFISASLLFPNAYYYYHRAAATRQAVGGFVPNNGITSMMVLPFLVASAVVMFILVLFFDTIFPGDGRKGLPWGFLFYKSFWRREGGEPEYEEDNFMKESTVVDKTKSVSDAPVEKVCAVQVDGLCKSASNQWIVNRVTMKIFVNEVTVLYGPRGAGGEEILEMIAGTMVPDHGNIEYKDGEKPLVGISASPCSVPQMTVQQLAFWVARMRGSTPEEADSMITEISLVAHSGKLVSQLTDVQEQQLTVLLAFIGEPEIVLLSEPTKNCHPEIKNVMLAFIANHKQGKSIIISSYDHVEAEVCDNVAFLSHGHLVTLGSISGVREKFSQLLNFVVWPGSGFTKRQRCQIEKLLNEELPRDSPKATWQMLANESICFSVKYSSAIQVHKIIELMETHREELSVKYMEVQRQNLHDAYCNAIRPHEEKDDLQLRAMPMPLKQLYQEPKQRSFWPELKSVFQMNLAFTKANWIMYLFYLIVPILIVFFFAFVSMMYSRHVTETEIGLDMLKKGVVGPAQVYSNMKLRNKLPSGVTLTSKGEDTLLQGGLLYKEPPVVVGLVNNKKTGFFHLYTMKLLRFGDLLVQNLFINSIIDSKSQEPVVQMWIESRDSPKWTSASFDQSNTWIPEMSSRELATMIIRQWKAVMIIGGMLGVMLARSAVFVTKLAGDNCIKMHFLMGARPVWYWSAIGLMDLVQFLIGLVLIVPLLMFLASMGGPSIGISVILCLLAFATTLPCIYFLALRYHDYFVALCTSLVFIGAMAILPACVPFFVRQYGATLEEWSEMFIVFAFLCPPLAASLGAAICNDLMLYGKKTAMETIKIVCPMLMASFVHVWMWLVIISWSTYTVQRFRKKASFWWKGKVTDPKTLGGSPEVDVYFNDASMCATPVPTSTSSAASGRAVAGKGPAANPLAGLVGTATTVGVQDTAYDSTSAVSGQSGTEHRGGSVEQETVLGLWEQRDEDVPKAPVLSYDYVQLDHYRNNAQVSFSIFDLQAICLLGDSPKARSYILDLAAGQAYPNSGSVTVNGIAASRTTGAGYVPVDDRLCTFLTGRQTLEIAARLKGVNIETMVDHLIGMMELDDVADRRVAEYTASDRRMLQFAVAVIDVPTCLLLDDVDAYVSPTQMRTLWAVACFLRQLYSVPILFSSSRVYECESASSHTIMLLNGDIVLGETTASVKKRYCGLVSLTLSVKENMDPETVVSVIVGQLRCDVQFHPNPSKLSFFLSIPPGRYVETVTRVRSLMATIGIVDYQMDAPDLYLVYHANFTNVTDM